MKTLTVHGTIVVLMVHFDHQKRYHQNIIHISIFWCNSKYYPVQAVDMYMYCYMCMLDVYKMYCENSRYDSIYWYIIWNIYQHLLFQNSVFLNHFFLFFSVFHHRVSIVKSWVNVRANSVYTVTFYHQCCSFFSFFLSVYLFCHELQRNINDIIMIGVPRVIKIEYLEN